MGELFETDIECSDADADDDLRRKSSIPPLLVSSSRPKTKAHSLIRSLSHLLTPFRLLAAVLIAILVWIVAAPLLANLLIVEKPLASADAIFVLGGAQTYVERTQKAAEIFKQGVATRVFLTDDGEESGWSKIEKRNPKYVELAANSLVSQGVPRDRITILEPAVTGTIYEARLLASSTQTAELKRVLLVTSAYHTRRTIDTFERVLRENGREIELGIVSPPTGEQTPPQFTWWLRKNGWKLVAGEYVKLVVYYFYY